MGRKKKVEESVENIIPMNEDAMNLPVEQCNNPVKKRIRTGSSLVNVREAPNGEVMFRIQNGTPILVDEIKDGWAKISGYVMVELIGDY